MRARLQNLEISKKLLAIMVLTAFLVVSITVVTLSAASLKQEKEQFKNQMRANALVMANNTAVALSFQDAETAKENIETLSADANILAAAVYDNSGELFADYIGNKWPTFKLPEKSKFTPGEFWHEEYLEVTVPLDRNISGHLTLYVSTRFIYDTLWNAFQIGGLLVVSMLITSYGLWRLLQGLISKPISNLVKTIEEVAVGQDYSLRVKKVSDDEVGALIDGFNYMLSEIQTSSQKLARHREQLEEEVHKRTKQLILSEARVRSILDSAGDGILVVSSSGEIASVNPRATEMFPNLNGHISSIFKHERDLRELERVSISLTSGENAVIQTELVGEKPFPASISVGSFLSGLDASYTLIISDTTRFVEAQEMLEVSRDAAFAANKAKSEFLANVSHEIRTPMNAIIGMTELCLNSSMSDELRENLETVMESAHSLLHLINDVLDFSKIEAGKLRIESSKFCLEEMVSSTARSLACGFHESNLELVLNIDPYIPTIVEGDSVRLRQILVNLLGNALKFTKKGEVVLSINLIEMSSQNKYRIKFEVKDTGIGIAKEQQQRIFEAFNQADSSTTRLYGGTGLGLTISNQLLKLMKSELLLESQFGVGSKFFFTLELDGETTPKAVPEEIEELLGIKLLVLDDNVSSLQALKRVLIGKVSSEPVSFKVALDALEFLENERPEVDLILTDYKMPRMDGSEFINKLRLIPKYFNTPVVVLSSLDDRLAGELTVQGTIPKPFVSKQVLNAILLATGKKVAETEAEREKIGSVDKRHVLRKEHRLKILVAEDNPVNQKVIKKVLQKRGHCPSVVDNGVELISTLEKVNYFSENTECDHFNLIITDIQMPAMGGVEATKVIRSRERDFGKYIPIIALSAHALTEQIEEYLKSGVDDYLCKPLDTAQLDQVLAKYQQREKKRK